MTRYEAIENALRGIMDWAEEHDLECKGECRNTACRSKAARAALALPEDGKTVDEKTLVDAARYNWLRNGGWEVMYDNKYWTKENRFDGAIDAGMLDVALQASQARSKPKGW